MNLSSVRTSTLVVFFASALVLSVSGIARSAELLRLSESQLDKVTAGFLAIGVAADAHAVSAAGDTFTNAVTQTNVNVGQPQDDGYIYTTGNGQASATAIGQAVQTGVGGGFDTNQDVVSVDLNLTNVTVAVSPRAPERTAQRIEADQRRQQQISDQRTAQDQRRQERRDSQTADSQSQQQLERLTDRYSSQDQRIAERRDRQDNRLESRLSRRDQRILERQIRADERHRAVAASQGIQPTLLQHQVLEITVVTRTAVQ